MRRMDCLQFRDRQYSTLSGGEQQRVLLAACIAQCPRLMLFDEPSTYLDVHQQLQCFRAGWPFSEAPSFKAVFSLTSRNWP